MVTRDSESKTIVGNYNPAHSATIYPLTAKAISLAHIAANLDSSSLTNDIFTDQFALFNYFSTNSYKFSSGGTLIINLNESLGIFYISILYIIKYFISYIGRFYHLA